MSRGSAAWQSTAIIPSMENPNAHFENKPSIELRRATENDLDEFIALEKSVDEDRTYSAMADLTEASEQLHDSKTYFILEDGKIVGNVSYEMKSPDHAYVSGLMVHPDYQNRGIGRAAMLKILDELKGIPVIDLVTHPENDVAIKLYESLGFTRGDIIENYFGDGESRMVMTLQS